MADVVSIILKLEQLRQFVSGADSASRAIEHLGDEAETTGKKGEQAGKKMQVNWRGVAKWAGGAAAIYGAQRYIRGATEATEDLAKSTLALQRTTGMDVETSSQWAAVAKARGISTKQLQVGFVKLSKEMEKSRQGTTKQASTMALLNKEYAAIQDAGGKKAPAALSALRKKMDAAEASGDKTRKTLANLGVTQRALAAGNTTAVLGQVAQGLSKIENPARRAALAQQLFGRGGQALLPILMKGRQGIQDQLAVVRKYGDYLGVKTVDQLKEMIANQREMRIASEGMKVQLGTALMPILFQFDKIIISITRALAPLIKNGWLFKGLIVALTAAFVYYRSVMIVAAIAQNVFNASMTITLGLIAAIPLLLAALVIGFIILYKRVGWFRAAVNATWAAVKTAFSAMLSAFQKIYGWVKSNWPLLLGILTGPFGLAAVLIIRHFGRIKTFVLGVVAAIKRAIEDVLNLVRSIPDKVTGALKSIPGAGAVTGAAGYVGKARDVLPFASGGTMPHHGLALVGERGPEIVGLPRGATVTPLSAPAAAVAGAGASTRGAGAEIVIPLYLDGREVARSVARVTADKLARK